MSETMEESSSIPNINLEGSKSNDVYEINFNVIIGVIIVIVLLVVGFFFWKGQSSKKETAAPTPTPTEVVTVAPTATLTLTPTSTPSANATPALNAKQKVKIQVQNGTGKAGDAAFLKSKLVAAGFATIDTGNADDTSADAVTSITYYGSFPSTYKVELTGILNEFYASVSATLSPDTSTYDTVIVTGKKK